jgi:daunorubicin C-13 ketoreductase
VIAENGTVEDLTVVVTGASSGIGLAAAEGLARAGARLLLVGRDPDRLATAHARVAAVATRQPPQALRADFERLDEVRELAQRLREAAPRIDVLANNAGGVLPARRTTVDGFEATIQANHLAPFLLTVALREELRGGRVVTTSSDAHRWAPVDPADLSWTGRRYAGMRVYGASKAANVLFAMEAARRWPDILSTSFHPGVVRSRFGRDALLVRLFSRVAPLLSTPEQGADTLEWLASAPAGELTNGDYYYQRKLRRPAGHAAEPERAAALWEASLAAVGAA